MRRRVGAGVEVHVEVREILLRAVIADRDRRVDRGRGLTHPGEVGRCGAGGCEMGGLTSTP
ncbi:hypothetical protein ACIQ6K_19445 [Streptomyces sp. NPDC096354]|uniref:hypothetical protein n=1 Tax=Streptomyces sp. NPDC096354 TaxID=3366088 RepID=UPI0038220C9E